MTQIHVEFAIPSAISIISINCATPRGHLHHITLLKQVNFHLSKTVMGAFFKPLIANACQNMSCLLWIGFRSRSNQVPLWPQHCIDGAVTRPQHIAKSPFWIWFMQYLCDKHNQIWLLIVSLHWLIIIWQSRLNNICNWSGFKFFFTSLEH